MKKNIAFLLTLLVLLSMLVGCAKQAAVPTAETPAAPTEEKTVEGKDTEKALGEEQAKEAMRLAGHKLPIKTKFVVKEKTTEGVEG